MSPGSAFFFPHGAHIYNRLLDFMRHEYRIRGYREVVSPNIYNYELWKVSGHYFKYREFVFFIDADSTKYGVKPMNCPGHCLMFDMAQKSYRDLPLRMADFGVLHRN
jgi:threonyl-tRNA synthetase